MGCWASHPADAHRVWQWTWTYRHGPPFSDIWRTASKFWWVDAKHPHSSVIVPDHLTRLRDRVAYEFGHNPLVKFVTALVTILRDKLDAARGWATFSASVDSPLFSGWGWRQSCFCSGVKAPFDCSAIHQMPQ